MQIQRRVEAWVHGTRYRKRYTFVPLAKISPELQHAVISAEDGRFYQHHGIDWGETEKVAQESQDKGKLGRGASTITQQLVKNLFFTTHRNPVRKAFEYTLAPMADWILGKRRVSGIVFERGGVGSVRRLWNRGGREIPLSRFGVAPGSRRICTAGRDSAVAAPVAPGAHG